MVTFTPDAYTELCQRVAMSVCSLAMLAEAFARTYMMVMVSIFFQHLPPS